MATAVSPVPYRSPLFDPATKLMTREWVRFFEQLSSGLNTATTTLNQTIVEGGQNAFTDTVGFDAQADILTQLLAQMPDASPQAGLSLDNALASSLSVMDSSLAAPAPVDPITEAALRLFEAGSPPATDPLAALSLFDTPPPAAADPLAALSLMDSPNANAWVSSTTLTLSAIPGVATSTQLPADVAYTDVANTFTAAGQTFTSSVASNRATVSTTAGSAIAGLALTANGTTWFIDNRGASGTPANKIAIYDPTVTEMVTLVSGGKVGVNNTNPSYALDVGGTVRATVLDITAGSNTKTGSGTLVGGTVAIANTSVTANSKVFLQDTTSGALTNVGALVVSSKTAGVGFTVKSVNVLDTSTFDYWILESA